MNQWQYTINIPEESEWLPNHAVTTSGCLQLKLQLNSTWQNSSYLIESKFMAATSPALFPINLIRLQDKALHITQTTTEVLSNIFLKKTTHWKKQNKCSCYWTWAHKGLATEPNKTSGWLIHQKNLKQSSRFFVHRFLTTTIQCTNPTTKKLLYRAS